MMNHSQVVHEDPIGTGVHRQCFVLIECPPPWKADELRSKAVSANLRSLGDEFYKIHPNGILLFIYNEKLRRDGLTRILIFTPMSGFTQGYAKQEIHVPSIEDVATVLKNWLAGEDVGGRDINPHVRDILICTHGAVDKRCGRCGVPFYRQANAVVADLGVESVRIWQSSHFGGHRFAPTVLDVPQCRYYAWLDASSFAAILTYNGDISCLQYIYRGWAILPYPAQAMERELIFQHGWEWFNYQVTCHIVEQSEDECFHRIELSAASSDGSINCYQADVIAGENLIKSADGKELISQYSVANLRQIK
jgi:hypothetical protein